MNWWAKNMRKKDGRFDTSRAGKMLALVMLATFFTFLIIIFLTSSVYFLVHGKLLMSVDDMKNLAYTAGVIVGSAVIPMLDYRFKELNGKK